MKKYKKKCYKCGNVDRFTIKEMSNLHFCQRCYKRHVTMCDVFANSVLELEKQNKRYREALEFYANKINYLTFIENGKSNIEHDQGEMARKALEGK